MIGTATRPIPWALRRFPLPGSPALDHLVFACADLPTGLERVTALLGAEPSPGGRHPRWGTRNALLALDDGVYLEVVGPDPESPRPPGGRGLGGEEAGAGGLVTWSVRVEDLAAASSAVASAGVDLGPAIPGERTRPDGSRLTWVLTDPAADRLGGVVPFLIDWGDSEHPARRLAAAGVAGRVDGLRLFHPEPSRVEAALAALGFDQALEVRPGAPALQARISTPGGTVTLGPPDR